MDETWKPASTPAALGRRLAEVRLARGLTQSQVAKSLGISRRYLCEIEAGKPSLYSDRLFRLLRLLGADLGIACSGDAEPSQVHVEGAA